MHIQKQRKSRQDREPARDGVHTQVLVGGVLCGAPLYGRRRRRKRWTKKKDEEEDEEESKNVESKNEEDSSTWEME